MDKEKRQKRPKPGTPATTGRQDAALAVTTHGMMPVETADQTATKSLENLYPGWGTVNPREAGMVGLPASASAYFNTGGLGSGGVVSSPMNILGNTTSQDSATIIRTLPSERMARYNVLRLMSKDPIIDSALKMHIANALAAKADSAEAIFIKSRDGKDNRIVDEINAALMPTIKKDLNEWARKAAVYGSCFARVYGKQGIGVQNIRCDYYTQPMFVQKYEKGGRLAGFTTTYQGTNTSNRGLRLMPPWAFVCFEIPEWWDVETFEPNNVGGIPVDLSVEDWGLEGLVESQEYGNSLIATAYGAWLDLLDALCSLKMSRRNAARLERLIGVNTGRLDPERAARYLDMIANRITNASVEVEKQSWLNGNVQTVVNHMFPVFGDKGGLQVDAVQGTPDIQGIEDVYFFVKQLGSGLGIDPSLLGFGDFLSGGLGDGGYFRMSIMAAVKATLLRKAMHNGVHRLCELHVAYKHGKVFLPGEEPWVIEFNAVNTAIEREAQESLEMRSNIAGGLIGSFVTIDQEFTITDKRELARHIWQMLNLPEESFEKVFPEAKAKEAEKTAATAGENEEDMDY